MTTETEMSVFTTLLITRLETAFDDFIEPTGRLSPLIYRLEDMRRGTAPSPPFSLLPAAEFEAIKAAYNKALLGEYEAQLVQVLAGNSKQWVEPKHAREIQQLNAQSFWKDEDITARELKLRKELMGAMQPRSFGGKYL